MDVVTSFPADAQTAEAVQPSESSFDDPAKHTQAAAMFASAFRNHGRDAALSQRTAMRFGIVRGVGLHALGMRAWRRITWPSERS